MEALRASFETKRRFDEAQQPAPQQLEALQVRPHERAC